MNTEYRMLFISGDARVADRLSKPALNGNGMVGTIPSLRTPRDLSLHRRWWLFGSDTHYIS